MTDIACPSCQKKYRLGDRFPAVFTCKACGTAMDLSSFPGAQVKAPAVPVAPVAAASAGAASAAPAAGAGGGSRAGSRARGGSGPRSRGSARVSGARGRRSREDDQGDGDDGEGRPKFTPARRGINPLLLWGSASAFVVVIVAFVLVLNNKKKPAPPTTAQNPAATGTPAAAPETADPAAPAATTPDAGSPAAPAAGPSGSGDPAPSAPEAGMSAAAPADPAPAGGKWYAFTSKVQIKPHDHHPDATPEERAKIDALIQQAVFENLGSDSRAAEKQLIEIGVKAAPKVANVFHTVKTTDGFENRTGLMKAQIADRILRRIDGVIERKFSVKLTPIHASSNPAHAEKIMRVWSWWVDTHGWTKPQPPWDEKVEGAREDAEEVAGSEAAMGGMSG